MVEEVQAEHLFQSELITGLIKIVLDFESELIQCLSLIAGSESSKMSGMVNLKLSIWLLRNVNTPHSLTSLSKAWYLSL